MKTKRQKLKIINVFGMAPPELLMSVLIIGVMALIVAVYVDRTNAVRGARDLTRFNHTQVIIGSILRYEIDTQGKLPAELDNDPNTWQMIATSAEGCSTACENKPVLSDCIELKELVPKYVEFIPQDLFFTATGASGYYINKQTKFNIVTVGACITETTPKIEIRQ